MFLSTDDLGSLVSGERDVVICGTNGQKQNQYILQCRHQSMQLNIWNRGHLGDRQPWWRAADQRHTRSHPCYHAAESPGCLESCVFFTSSRPLLRLPQLFYQRILDSTQ